MPRPVDRRAGHRPGESRHDFLARVLPPWNDFSLYSPVLTFDGRHVVVFSEPETTEPIGSWCKVREVLNAKDPDFSHPHYGPEETLALAGCRNALALPEEPAEAS